MEDYRGKVGPAELYELIGAHQFCVMVKLGLRDHHKLLDFGCGSLRGGKYFINYLKHGNYVGIEPNVDLVEDGIRNELTDDVWLKKNPTFMYWDDFSWASRIEEQLGFKFDYVLAQSILTHAGRDIVSAISDEAFRSLVPGGTFAATFFVGFISSVSMGWLGNEIASYTEKFMKDTMASVGFSNTEVRSLGHPVGQIWVIAKKG